MTKVISFTVKLNKLKKRPKTIIDLNQLLHEITDALQKKGRNVQIMQGYTIHEILLSFTTSKGKIKFINFHHTKKQTTISHYDENATNRYSDTVEEIIYQLYLRTNPTSYEVSCAADSYKHKEFELRFRKLFDQGIRQKDSSETKRSPKKKMKRDFIQVTDELAKEDELKIEVSSEKTTSQETDPKPKSGFKWSDILPKAIKGLLNFGKQNNTA